MAAGARADQHQTVGTVIERLAGIGDGIDVGKHQSAVVMDAVHHPARRPQSRDHQFRFEPQQQLVIGVEARGAGMGEDIGGPRGGIGICDERG